MKKSVLRSIKPYWVYLICEGKKNVEVGKDWPKSEAWDKTVYIYCSKDLKSFNRIPQEYKEKYRPFLGKIIGEFVCENITRGNLQYGSCLTMQEISQYSNGKQIYGWNISDLVIYNKPKELNDFNRVCDMNCNAICECGCPTITRPPQTWCYVA